MKKLFLLLIFILILGSFPACGESGDKFDLTYETERTEYLVGETVEITAKVTNISGKTYRYHGGYSDYRPYIRLYPVLEDDKLGAPLDHLPIASTDDAPSRHKIADGESGQVTFEFQLSEDAYIGKYTVELSYGDAIEVFPRVLTVLKPSAQNEKDGLPYSPVTVSSGEGEVRPLRGLSFINEYVNGELALCGDGMGVYWFFDDPELDHNDFPCLVLDGEITVSDQGNVHIYGAKLYDLNYEKIDYSGGFEGLSDLPAGEYLVVFDELYDESLDDPTSQTYEKVMYENLFKLIVRS